MDEQVKHCINVIDNIVGKWNEHALGLPANSRANLNNCWRTVSAHLRMQDEQLKIYEANELSRKKEEASNRGSNEGGEKGKDDGPRAVVLRASGGGED